MPEETDQTSETPNTPKFVRVHSMVRRRQTRLQRYQATRHHRFKQYVFAGSRRLIRGRFVDVTWEHMLLHRFELLDKWHKGLIEVRSLGGEAIDLRSLEVLPARAPAPRPNFRLDSAAYDLAQGRPIEQFHGGVSSQDPNADEFARQLAAEKAEEAARKASGEEAKDEQELEGMFGEIDQELADGSGERIDQVEEAAEDGPAEETGAAPTEAEAQPMEPAQPDVLVLGSESQMSLDPTSEYRFDSSTLETHEGTLESKTDEVQEGSAESEPAPQTQPEKRPGKGKKGNRS